MSKKTLEQHDIESSLAVELLMNSVLMAKYAASNGKKIPEHIGLRLMEIEGHVQESLEELRELRLRKKLDIEKIQKMKALEVEINKKILNDIQGITTIHGVLSEIVSPANPRSIFITEPALGIKGRIRDFPLFKRMIILGLIFLAGYIFFKFDFFNLGAVAIHKGWLQTFVLRSLTQNLIYQAQILFAAGLGSIFYILFTANRYLVERTFDNKYNPSYWNRLFLGIIAGCILTNIIVTEVDPSIVKFDPSGNLAVKMTATVIALLGGFSTDVVYRILRRIVEMLLTLVRGETRDLIELQKKDFEMKASEKIAKTKLNTAASLLRLQEEITQKLKQTSVDKFNKVLESLMEKGGEL